MIKMAPTDLGICQSTPLLLSWLHDILGKEAGLVCMLK